MASVVRPTSGVSRDKVDRQSTPAIRNEAPHTKGLLRLM